MDGPAGVVTSVLEGEISDALTELGLRLELTIEPLTELLNLLRPLLRTLALLNRRLLLSNEGVG